MIKKLWKNFIGSTTHQCSLFVPSYDEATIRMAEWAKNWEIPKESLFRGDQASHENAFSKLNGNKDNKAHNIIAFVGHGSPTELHTDRGIGKPSVTANHGCLLNCEDLGEKLSNIHIVAWSCSSGKVFGKNFANHHKSAFIGFKEEIVMVFNHPESEDLWSNIIKEMILRIKNKNQIETDDKQWLKTRVKDIRQDIKSSKINTGKYNSVNLWLLNRIGKSIDVHIGGM